LADRGFVAISADYRVTATHRTTPVDSVRDACAALDWIRTHATTLGIDPQKVVAAGASAGGHLALMTALAPERAPANRPDALMLLYPILDTGPGGYGHALFGDRFPAFSPLHRLRDAAKTLPPTLLLTGDADSATPIATVRAFQTLAQTAGRRCEVVIFPGGQHPLYAYREGGGPLRAEVLNTAATFLATLPGFSPKN
jgi:acetyl esterase/lipase